MIQDFATIVYPLVQSARIARLRMCPQCTQGAHSHNSAYDDPPGVRVRVATCQRHKFGWNERISTTTGMKYQQVAVFLVTSATVVVYVLVVQQLVVREPANKTLRYSTLINNFEIFTPKNYSQSLADAFGDDALVVYFLHQRKAGGSSIRQFLFDQYIDFHHIDIDAAKESTYIPCLSVPCRNWDPSPRSQFINTKRLLAGHLSYTTVAARAVYGEQQVLLTNFRQPLSRIISCFFFRFSNVTWAVLSKEPFNVTSAAEMLIQKPDSDGDTCAGEPFRMLSPYDPNQPRTEQEIATVCAFVQNYVHMLDLRGNMTNTTTEHRIFTQIEEELSAAIQSYRVNVNGLAHDAQANKSTAENLRALQEFLPRMPVVQSELQLYDCVS